MMRVYAISDLHGYLPTIPDCDLLLLGGDYNEARNVDMQIRFMKGRFNDWLKEVPARYIVGVAGNHDFVAESHPEIMRELNWIYLQDELVDIEGVKIYGTPWTPTFGDWAFMKHDTKLKPIFSNIPEGLDILLTHGPAHRRLDKTLEGISAGSPMLRERIEDTLPDSVVCGHIHEARGMFDDGATRYFNVSHVTRNLDPVYHPVYIPLRAG